jgi:hypothetical protein
MWIKETIMGMYLKRYNGGYQQRGDMIVSENWAISHTWPWLEKGDMMMNKGFWGT